MKRITPFLLLLLSCLVSVNAYGQFKIGVVAGYHLSMPDIQFYGQSLKKYMQEPTEGNLSGFEAGISVEYDFLEYVSLLSGVQMSMKGYRIGDFQVVNQREQVLFEGTAKSDVFYLDIPLYISGKYPISDDVSAMIVFGPKFSVGLWGDEKLYDVHGIVKHQSNIFDPNEAAVLWLQRFGFGLYLGAGLELFDSWQLKMGYTFDLVNGSMVPGVTYQQNAFTASLSYMIPITSRPNFY